MHSRRLNHPLPCQSVPSNTLGTAAVRSHSSSTASERMAHLLAKFGEAALKAQKVNGVWRRAAISARVAAKLRKEALLAGEEWPYEKPVKPKKAVKCKGHKHDRLAVEKWTQVEKNMAEMPQKIAEYRESLKEKNVPILERLLMTRKQRQMRDNRK